MEYLQYLCLGIDFFKDYQGFKPCYKWNTFNTLLDLRGRISEHLKVLNLVINGIPSIQKK